MSNQIHKYNFYELKENKLYDYLIKKYGALAKTKIIFNTCDYMNQRLYIEIKGNYKMNNLKFTRVFEIDYRSNHTSIESVKREIGYKLFQRELLDGLALEIFELENCTIKPKQIQKRKAL